MPSRAAELEQERRTRTGGRPEKTWKGVLQGRAEKGRGGGRGSFRSSGEGPGKGVAGEAMEAGWRAAAEGR